MILSLGPKVSMPKVNAGDVLRIEAQTEPSLGGVATAIGVGRILISRGKTPDLGPANQPRHPRSMIGWNDRHYFLVVVDGRQSKLSIGMTYPEMAGLMKEYGCDEAAELDGGGSSTLWAGGKVLNSPSDGHVRAIANGLLVFPEDGKPAKP
jgi:exopolysaccharide biosynthesis protein